MLAWHLLPNGRLDSLSASLHAALERPGLSPVPPQWLHLTTQGVGLEHDVDDEIRRRLVAAAAERCAAVAPVDALAGPPRVVAEGLTLDVEPAALLSALRDLLQDADAAVRGRDAVPDWRAPFWPHITLAYANGDAEAEEIEARRPEPVRFDSVTLLRLHRSEQLYHWDVIASVPLTGGA